ncbi:MAG: type II secretion system F family protein [Anaerolineales bacterium]|nr:type II secretion system F family protein [Anaerolineales bacterium]MCX7755339.1 type II secretion system F family protein [Anaerolineales bacterium]MDW8279132.1 type II secretion system F family protein [Anaerolineales bacterium]
MTTIILVVVVAIILLAVALIYVGQRLPKRDEDPLSQRLAEFSQRGEAVSLDEIELSQPFAERVIYPVLRQLGEMAAKNTPQNALQETTRKLELAGKAGVIDAPMFLASRFVAAGVLGILVFGVAAFSIFAQPISSALLYGILAAALGFFFPQLWLSEQIKKRQLEIRKAMPDALDLLTICVEAGLGFDAAMSNVAEKWDNELSLAFARAIREIQLGKVRREALKSMAERIDLPEMTSFVAAIIQSEQLGVSMAKVLRIQADQMRMRRRQLAEELAHQAPVKMLVPMVVFIFPSIFIVLMTPAVLRIMQSNIFGGG